MKTVLLKRLLSIASIMILIGCQTISPQKELTPEEIKFEKDHNYCDALTENSVVTHPNYIRCMNERGWNLPE